MEDTWVSLVRLAFLLLGGIKMNYNQMRDEQLARIMVSYIGRVNNLQCIIGRYLEDNNNISSLQVV